MLRFLFTLFILLVLAFVPAKAQEQETPVTGKVLKVLPQLLDQKGRSTISPSLFDRDAYQALLRSNADQVSGIRYDVNWKAKNAEFQTLTLRVELRGLHEEKVPREKTLETSIAGKRSLRKWTSVKLTGDDYAEFGRITAWRATLWCDGTLIDEYKSFLW